tara:strand:+ start:2118 stop:2258 length:141 start_codon:yes stop_codon:yes gene_type:complete
MSDLGIFSMIVVAFISGFSFAIVTFIIGGYMMVKKGVASKLMSDVG